MKRKLACLLTSCIVAVAAALPAFAAEEDADFVPSVEPESSARIVNAAVTIDGEDYDLEGIEALGLEMIVTPLSEADSAVNADITKMLKDADADVQSGIKFTDSADQEKFDAAKPELDLQELVDVSIVYSNTKELFTEATNVTFTLQVDNGAKVKAVAHDDRTTGWELVGDIPFGASSNDLTINVASLSPFAFYVDKAAQGGDTSTPDDSSNGGNGGNQGGNGGGTAPSTGTTNGLLYAIPAAVAVVGGIVLVKRAKKN